MSNTFNFQNLLEERIKALKSKWSGVYSVTYQRKLITAGKEVEIPEWLPLELKSYYATYERLEIVIYEGKLEFAKIKDFKSKHSSLKGGKVDGEDITEKWLSDLVYIMQTGFNNIFYHIKEEKVLVGGNRYLARLQDVTLSQFVKLNIALLGVRNLTYPYLKNKSLYEDELKEFKKNLNLSFNDIKLPQWIDFDLPNEFVLQPEPQKGDRVVFVPYAYLRGEITEIKGKKVKIKFDTGLEGWVFQRLIFPVPEDTYEAVYRNNELLFDYSWEQLLAFEGCVTNNRTAHGRGLEYYVGETYNLTAIFKSLPIAKTMEFVIRNTENILDEKNDDDIGYYDGKHICQLLWNALIITASHQEDKKVLEKLGEQYNKQLTELSKKVKEKFEDDTFEFIDFFKKAGAFDGLQKHIDGQLEHISNYIK